MSEFSRNLAFVIGINNYGNGISSLQNAVNDAKKLVEILRTKHGYQVWVCLDEIATLSNLKKFLEQTLPQQIKADDRLLFYFAGHGIALNGDDGPQGYLIPQDAKLGDTKTYLPMTQLQECLSNLPCRHFLGILDCCFAGAFRWSSTRDLLPAPKVIHKERYDRFITDPAWQVITSAAYDQKALDAFVLNTERGQIGDHSPFAAALLEALEGKADAYPPAANGKSSGDGVITATELYLYLRDAVEPGTEGYRQRQTPGIWPLKKHDKGEYIFLAPGHPLNLPPAPPLDESQNPYRGLQSFDERHSHLFFGRQALTEQLYQYILGQPLTVVLGASGTGKSSLVKAGLIPYIKRMQNPTPVDGEGARQQWRILAPMRPGESPLRALNNTLTQENSPVYSITSLPSIEKLETLSTNLATWMELNPQSNLLLIVDQFEELITLCRDEQEQENFINFLAKAVNEYPEQLRLVLTLRSDFEPQFRNTALERHWAAARFIVPAMTRGELRQAIEEPASAKVMYFQSDDPNYPLVDRLIDEVADMPGTLPLLSFTLSELYLKYLKRQRIAQQYGETIDRAIAEADYRELGGVMRSLTQRADSEYEELVKQDRAYEQTIRHVMLRMVAVGGGELARRRVPLSELEYPEPENARVKKVIRRFSTARLLVEGQDTEGNPYVEPAHDALVRGWQKLLAWKQDAEENLILQRRLTPAAQEWKNIKSQKQPTDFQTKAEPILKLLDRSFYFAENLCNKINTTFVRSRRRTSDRQEQSKEKPRQFLWNANPYLEVLHEQLKSGDRWFNQLEAEFVQQSVMQKQRNIHLRWSTAIGVTTVSIVLTTLTLFGLRGTLIGQIRTSRKTAEVSLNQNQTLDGMLEILHAGKIFQHPLLWLFPTEQKLREQVRGTLQKAVYTVRESNRQEMYERPLRSVSFSPDGKQLATSGDDSIVRVWNMQGQVMTKLQGHTDSVRSIVFSPDGQLLASAGDDSIVRVWNMQGQLLAELKGHQGSVRSVSFSPNNLLMASAGDDSIVRIWNMRGQLMTQLQGHKGSIKSVSFSPDSQLIASGGDDQIVRVWNLQTQQVKELKGHQKPITGVSFSPDGQRLASGGEDDTARLWNLQGRQLKEWKTQQIKPWGVAFTPDGQQLATAGGDGTVRFWNLQGKEFERFVGHQGPVRSLSFRRDGQVLASAADDLTVRLWNLRGQQFAQSTGHQQPVNSVSFSPDSRQIVSAGNDGTFLLNLQNRQLTSSTANRGSFKGVSFSPDGQRWAAAGKDGIIRLWNLQGQLLAELRGHQGLVNSVSFSPDGQKLISAGNDDTIRLWKTQNQHDSQQQPLVWKAQQQGVNSVSFSPDGQLIVSAGQNSTVFVWDLQGQQQRKFEEHLGPVHSSVFSPDGKQIASGGEDGTVRLWNLQGETIRLFQLYGPRVMSLVFSRDGKRIVSGTNNGNVQLWDVKTEDQLPLAAWETDESSVNSVALSQDDKLLATGGNDGTVKVWQIESFDELMNRACDRLDDYLKNNTHQNRDRRLCNN
ncbi:nSTAND1 domain-containing NTPase [Fischerella sp. PCC 9605]|uniref:nSTAND1 domain-containing NTPase n=1 Tax=Fischerella sp. PCC 9605 TaxID=1173024 RepID=UPI00047ECBC8|nr:caspase family protein [Fischerella sp. PCC 9605]